MKLDLSQKILDAKNHPIPLLDDKGQAVEGEFTTIGSLAEIALIQALPGEERLPTEEKRRRYKLFVKIAPGGEVDLTGKEIDTLKDVIGRGYASPLIVGRALDLLDPES